MLDGIIKGTGDSRYLKSVSDFLTKYPSYADFAAALIAGTLPVDFNGINTAGWQKTGTPLNKANLLSDATAAKFAAETPDTVNAALGLLTENNMELLLSICRRRCVKVTAVMSNGAPAVGQAISGINPIIGSTVITDKNGIALGYATANSTTVSISATNYIDVTGDSKQIATPEDSITDVTLTVRLVSYVKLTKSQSVKFSPLLKSLSVTAVGGGGGGGCGSLVNSWGGRGGGGGYVTAQTAIAFSADTSYALIVGAGGTGEKITVNIDQFGSDGGTSTFLGLSALGGHTGGTGADAIGNGNGGANSLSNNPVSHDGGQGSNGFGGGGGGGAYATANDWVFGGLGGSPAGGQGGGASYNARNPGNNGTDGYGGGGGGGGQGGSNYGGVGGNGGCGCVILEMEH